MPHAQSERISTPYDPDADLAENWPQWTVRYENGDEAYEMFDEVLHEVVLCLTTLTNVIDKANFLTHAICHLDLGHLDCDDITEQEEVEADHLARKKQL